MKGTVYLEDGSVFKGTGFGADGTRVGEIVFNTAMTGYQKSLTDPSYCEQILTMTYPLIGNYGINATDNESEKIHAYGLIARDICFRPSNWKCVMNIDEWLKQQNVPGVYNVDTREITMHIRSGGSQKCVITTEDMTVAEMRKLCEETVLPTDQMKRAGMNRVIEMKAKGEAKFHVAVLDLGIKRSILNEFQNRGCDLTVFPYGTTAEEIMASNPSGIFLSNGPGDPMSAPEAIKCVNHLTRQCHYGPDQVPIMGICMGHQLLALAAGGSTYKMKYGHHGVNHGVFDKTTGRSYITSQNHSYCVKVETAILRGLDVTHLNLNDGTVEGLQSINKPIFSVQFHPESSPGPNDTGYLFDKFVGLMKGGRL